MPAVNQQVMVGDLLALDYGVRERRYRLIQVSKITPSGRIICGTYELNPDLTIRGRPKWSTGPVRAEIVTDEIKELVRRDRLVSSIVRQTQECLLRGMSTMTLQKIHELTSAAPTAASEKQ